MTRLLSRLLTMTCLTGLALAAPGCIFDKMHEEMVRTNNYLDESRSDFGRLQELRKLEELEKLNDRVAVLQERLDGIDDKLGKLDVHLTSLRKTINNIDTSIPLLGSLSGDSEEEKEALESAKTPPKQEPEKAAPSPEPDEGEGEEGDPDDRDADMGDEADAANTDGTVPGK